MNRLVSVLFWSVISAAFIGPGTVTVAASAGAGFSYALLWALVFSTTACVVLQEASARLTVASGSNLGQALRQRYPGGLVGTGILVLVLGAVVVGCAAYEAGNILGGVAGAALVLPLSPRALTLLTVLVAAFLLWFSSPRKVALLLSVLVAIMGLAFLLTAVRLGPPVCELVRGSLTPRLPEGSALLAAALVGTTVVPYNLFLGSGLARGQDLGELRFGLTVAIVVGGLISMGVVVVGAAMEPPLEFSRLSEVLSSRLGGWAQYLFAFGLFSAGLSSAVTAPLAAAMTARSMLAPGGSSSSSTPRSQWSNQSARFRSVWAGVLGVGLLFGVSGAPPVPVIILAQALNGVLLPAVAVFLLIAVNNHQLMRENVNGLLSNLLMGGIVLVSLFLGLMNLGKATARALGLNAAPSAEQIVLLTAVVAGVIAVPVWRSAFRSSAEARLKARSTLNGGFEG
jgi:Mn2+/Fe2+ NRAMP family transporter